MDKLYETTDETTIGVENAEATEVSTESGDGQKTDIKFLKIGKSTVCLPTDEHGRSDFSRLKCPFSGRIVS